MSHKKFNEEYDSERPVSGLDFALDKQTLSDIFKIENMNSGESAKNIKNMGLIQGIASKLKTDVKNGLSSLDYNDFSNRERSLGKNSPIIAAQPTLWQLILDPFDDMMLRIILVASLVDIAVGIYQGEAADWIDGIAIMVAVILIVLFSATNAYMQGKQFEKLYKEAAVYNVQVIRDSKTTFIKNTELLVGDLLKFGIGDILQVDGLMVQGSETRIDESNITGETKEIYKATPTVEEFGNPFMISGAKVTDGAGVLLVCTVGVMTQLGQMKLKLQEDKSPTPLELKLEKLSNLVGVIAFGAALLTVGVLLINFGIDIYEGTITSNYFDYIMKDFVIGVTIIVVAVPEGLPLAVNLSLAFSVLKMREENNWVRFPSACETMGGVDAVCTDKTGTLTTNSMKVENLYFEESYYTPLELSKGNISTPKSLQLLCESIAINSSVQRKTLANGKVELDGNKTEIALVNFADSQGFPFDKYRLEENIVHIVPFSSKRKKMIVVYKLSKNQYRVYVKGASEVILGISGFFYNKQASQTLMNKSIRDQIMNNTIEVYAADALRTITLAYKDINILNPQDPILKSEEFLEKELILLAIFGIRDPLREEIPLAIEKCNKAGITVRMVTGDNSQTAVSIAKKAGILPANYLLNEDSYVVMEGHKFTKEIGGLIEVPDPDDKDKTIKEVKNLTKFNEIMKELRVMSRSAPEDKYNMVTGLKQGDHVVAVTGDGTNDAPALKKANIGFAMESGSAVAKEAAGIILLDDNFSSIVLACKWGRNIFDSIRKFVQFQMTINVVALVLAFLGSAVFGVSPLNAVEMLLTMLWINLIMDTFAALALATEPPTEELLDRKPHGKTEDIISPGMKRFIFGHSVYQLTVLLIILFDGPALFNIPDSANMTDYNETDARHYTIFFHAFVMMQVFNMINSRKLNKKDLNVFKNFCNNGFFFSIMIMIVVAQFLIVEVGGQFIKTSPLTLFQHLVCIAIGSVELLVGLLFKVIPEEIFDKCKIFKEDKTFSAKNMDRGITSKLRRGASSRISSTHKSYSTNI